MDIGIDAALKAFRATASNYREYDDYYDGVHRLAFATEKFRNAFGSLFRAFADNLCPAVVDAVADRLEPIGFEVEDGPEQAADMAWDIWTRNRMDRRAGEAHLDALRAGDAYLVVWPNPDDSYPTLYPNPGSHMRVWYDDERPSVVSGAAKLWELDDGRMRLNMYYVDRIEKYVTRAKVTGGIPQKGTAFDPYEVEGEAWPLPNEYGVVPVFHFANNASIGQMGRSELRDVIPLQDALNKAVADMLVAMEFVAFPQRWATGLEVEIDESTGKPKAPFTPGVDRVWAVGSELAKFGQFDPSDLTQFLGVQDNLRLEIARVSGTPLHYLMLGGGEFPSGEAMKTAEARFLAKVKDRQVAFGNAWEDALGLAVRMAGGPEARLSMLWTDPTPRSDREMVEIGVMKKDVGVSERQIQLELGYSEEQIERMAKEREEQTQQLGDAMLGAFERGQDE